jgi:hypothetical protein
MKPGSALGDDFHFSSETNEKQMSKEQLLTIVKNIEKLITG